MTKYRPKSERSDVDWNNLAAIATVFSSIVASAIGLYGVYIGTKALELSDATTRAQSRPNLHLTSEWGPTVSLSIENVGLGPYKITQALIAIPDMEQAERSHKFLIMQQGEGYPSYTEFEKIIGIYGINEEWGGVLTPVLTQVPAAGASYGASESIDLILVEDYLKRDPSWRNMWEESLENAVFNIAICISYESIFGETATLDARNGCALKTTLDEDVRK
ncbi:hypothetical protein [Ponticoccus alexandrii]|uniref:Uncharacterized protein n=1 Tax=Ponticoccus alexandrii TaxID=1943633 RepID=A0ABX7FD37_9RHOB|nr:hypothetical protein [Ponticoccus alexandrii]QRF67494.1 hypothetical protein GQA70_14945 [Ponticoccus alexandrii]